MTGQEQMCPFNTDDCLIDVTTCEGLTVNSYSFILIGCHFENPQLRFKSLKIFSPGTCCAIVYND